MENILSISNLTKSYGEKKVVNNISLNVKKGHIYGLIGPNGAGKTTIMKILAGTTMADTGEVSFFGGTDEKSKSRMSFMIETPYIDKALTARQNLEYIRYLRGISDKARIDSTLELVGLAGTDKKTARHFSLGMKQRLGIAMALISKPEIMILDEPVNGLDPEGIVHIRNLLLKLCHEENVTIIISSHLLTELYELCTDFVLINDGCIVESLSKEALDEKCSTYIAINIETPNIEELITVLEQQLNIREYKLLSNEELRIYDHIENIGDLSRCITNNGFTLTKLAPGGDSLEEFYLSKIPHKKESESHITKKFALRRDK